MQLEPRELSHEPVLEPRWLDVDTASRYLCMSVDALYHRVARRQIPFVKNGRSVRFDRQALDRWMSKGVKHGFGEARRDLVLREANQRPAVSRVHRVRGQEIGRTTRVGDRARHPRRDSRLEEHDPQFRGMVGRVPRDVHAAENGQEP